MTAAEYEREFVARGVRLTDFRNVVGSIRRSERKKASARKALTPVVQDLGGYAVLAFGSLGRMEFTSGSDLDLAVVYDRRKLGDPRPIWRRTRRALREVGFDVSAKTFAEPFPIGELATNIGGDRETNRSLTYRVLLLTEGDWLGAPSYAEALHVKLLDAYRDARTTRGKFLTSLSNDLHRYYRTLCVDYHHKISERRKEWGIRYIKLRHSRKIWHLGNVCLQCAAFLLATSRPDGEALHDGYLSEHLRDPPLLKILRAMRMLGHTELMLPILNAYDIFLGYMNRQSAREELEAVTFDEQRTSRVMRVLKRNADDLNEATLAVAQKLLRARCGSHLIRYGVL